MRDVNFVIDDTGSRSWYDATVADNPAGHGGFVIKELIPLKIRRLLGTRWDQWHRDRAKAQLLRSLGGNAVQCNVCGWEGSGFTDDCWHPGTICPNCGSQVRHRLLVAALDGQSSIQGLSEHDLLKGKSVLHFAPERQLRERVRNMASRHITADFDRGDCDLRLDISRMPDVGDSSFDAVIVCDVLEHVPDDASALREIFRVLAPTGTAILTVPQKDPPSTTDEDVTVLPEAEREKRFGQKDHVRMYGEDFIDRVKLAGFTVSTVDQSAFPDDIIARHVLHPPVLNPNPLATNHRKIYFARK